VQIELIVRGACALRPGVRGISSRIRVRSVVGRFLEHSRVFAFGNGGNTEVYLGSADWMQRNINERVEVMFRLKDPALCSQVFTQVISPYLADTEKTRILMPSGDYVRSRKAGEFSASRNGFRFNAQEFLIGFSEAHDDLQAFPPLPRYVKLPAPRKAGGKSQRIAANASSPR
jgi:polyphosphate kinase